MNVYELFSGTDRDEPVLVAVLRGEIGEIDCEDVAVKAAVEQKMGYNMHVNYAKKESGEGIVKRMILVYGHLKSGKEKACNEIRMLLTEM